MFFVIGAPRCGTTYLYESLKIHPDFELSETKERHHFDRLYPLPRCLSLIRGGEELEDFYRNPMTFMSNDRHLEIYPRQDTDKLHGDFTVTYAALPSRAIREISRLYTDSTVIYVFRNWKDRSFSCACHNVGESGTEDDIVSHLESGACRIHNEYSENWSRWREHFSGQIHVLEYDRLVRDPESYLTWVCQMLGASAPTERIDRPILSSSFHHVRTARIEAALEHVRPRGGCFG